MSIKVDYYVEQINKIIEQHNSYKNNKSLQNINDEISELHAADLCEIFENISHEGMTFLFSHLPSPKKADVFIEFSNKKRHEIFLKSTNNEREILLHRSEEHTSELQSR